MKKKKGTQTLSRDERSAPVPESSEHFSLDDIIREFGGTQSEDSVDEPEVRATAPWSDPATDFEEEPGTPVSRTESHTDSSDQASGSSPRARPKDSSKRGSRTRETDSPTKVLPSMESVQHQGDQNIPPDPMRTITFPQVSSNRDTAVFQKTASEPADSPKSAPKSSAGEKVEFPSAPASQVTKPSQSKSVPGKQKSTPDSRRKVLPFLADAESASENAQTPTPPQDNGGNTSKKKVFLSPEAQYRRAAEGHRSRCIRLILCGLFAVLSLVLGIFRCQGLLDHFDGQGLLSFGELALLILCALTAFDVLVHGLTKIVTFRFDLSSLLLVEVVLGVIHGFLCLRQQTTGYSSLICLSLTCGLWGLILQKNTVVFSMDTARKNGGHRALMKEPGLFLKQPGVLCGKGNMKAFLEQFDKTSLPQRLLNLYALLVLVVGIVGAIVSPGKHSSFIENWLTILLAGTPIFGFLVLSRPWSILSGRLAEKGAALCGWSGATQLSGKLCVSVSGSDLFPGDSIKLNGIKYFSGINPDRVVSYMAAIMEAIGSDIAYLFQEQVEIRGARHHTVTRFRRYESGGVSAEIGLDSVLVGSLRFMQSMGVEMPSGTRVSQAIYLAIDGELAGVFALQHSITKSSAEALAALSMGRNITPLITSSDFVITESFLRSRFRVDTTRILFPHLNVRAELAKAEPSQDASICALIKDNSFETKALCISGSRALTTAITWGLLIAVAGGCMGLTIMTILTFLETQSVISLTNLALYQLIWAVPGYLLSGWTKNP